MVLGIAGCGGIGPTFRFADACQQAGVEFRFYSGDLGIATAAQLHVAAVLGSVTGPHQSLLRWYHDDVITGGPLRPHRGRVPVPDSRPGLGVELDLELTPPWRRPIRVRRRIRLLRRTAAAAVLDGYTPTVGVSGNSSHGIQCDHAASNRPSAITVSRAPFSATRS